MQDKTLSQRLNDLFEKVKKYLQLRLDYLTLTIGEYAVFIMARLILVIVLFWAAIFATLFLAGGLVAWIGMATGNWPVAMLAGAGVFIFIGLFVYIFRKPFIINPMNRLYLKLLELKQNNGNDGKE
jgi:hypothetical protein